MAAAPNTVDQHRLVVSVARDDGAPLVIATQVGRHGVGHHGADRASFQALVADGEVPLVISDVDIPAPSHGWELRTSGLWVDHICETPLEHWSYGLEAFALAIDDPGELLGRGFGDRVPLGWELEFEASEPPQSGSGAVAALHDSRGPVGASGHYRQLGTVHGLVLRASGEVEIEGRAIRSHRWGDDRFDEEVVLADGSAETAGRHVDYDVEVALPGVGEVWWVARTRAGVRTRTDYEPGPSSGSSV